MDIGMPIMDGIQAANIIHTELPQIQIVGMSMFEEEEQAVRMKEAGAVAYVTKSASSEAVIRAIRTAAQF
jgi:DNA-binding NarL/FixJ family response regulator